MSILGIDKIILVYITHGKIFYIPYRFFCLHYVQTKFPYTIQTKILLSIPDIDILSICHVEKSIFIYIAQRKIFYIKYKQNIIFYSPYRQYIVNINQKHYLFIFMDDLNSTKKSIFTLIKTVYIKNKQRLLIFRFSQMLTLSMNLFMMSPQSHKNIIWNPKLISNHIFLSTFVENNAIKFTFFFELFYKLIDSKKRAFCFWNYLLSPC